MDKKRLIELLNNYIEYCYNLKNKDSKEDKEIFYKNIIGFTDNELKYFDIEI